MTKFCRYRPTAMMCFTVFISLMIIFRFEATENASANEIWLTTLLKIIQFVVLTSSMYLEYKIYQQQKHRFYTHVNNYMIQLHRLQLWENEKYTPQMILGRYYATFEYFETSLQLNNKRIYKKYAVKFAAVQGEYNRLKNAVNLTHDDLFDFKLSVKTLLF